MLPMRLGYVGGVTHDYKHHGTTILFAALDVYHREPLPADHPLIRCPNTVLTPHLGYSVLEVYAEYYQHSVENALAFLDGKPLRVLEQAVH